MTQQVTCFDPQQLARPDGVNLPTMVAGITSRLTGAVGYAYTITHNGQVVAEDGVRGARSTASATSIRRPAWKSCR